MNRDVEHIGIIKEINGNSIVVAINNAASCSKCTLSNLCKPQSDESREITLFGIADSDSYSVNEKVKVVVAIGLRKTAIIVAMIIPCLILVGALLISNSAFNLTDSISAMVSLSFLAIYYIMIYKMRDSLMKKYNLTIEKL